MGIHSKEKLTVAPSFDSIIFGLFTFGYFRCRYSGAISSNVLGKTIEKPG